MGSTVGHISQSDDLTYWTVDDFFSSFDKIDVFDIRSPTFQFANESFWFEVKPTFFLKHTEKDTFVLSLWKKEDSSVFNVRLGISRFHERAKGSLHRLDSDKKYAELNFLPQMVMYQSGCHLPQLKFFCEIYKEEVGAAEATLSTKESQEKTEAFERVVDEQKSTKSKSLNKLLGDFKELLTSGKDSDVTFKVEDREFKAHRLILGIRSPVFSAMFQHDMSERQSGVVDIEDCNSDTFMDFLLYLYTGTVRLDTENAAPLYATADKYQVMELKGECLDYVKRNLSVDNFCEVYLFTLEYHELEVVEIATQFFHKKASDIVQTPKWKRFLARYPSFANDLFVARLQANER